MLNSIFILIVNFIATFVKTGEILPFFTSIYHIPAALPAVAVGNNAHTGPGDPFCSTAEAIMIHWVVDVLVSNAVS